MSVKDCVGLLVIYFMGCLTLLGLSVLLDDPFDDFDKLTALIFAAAGTIISVIRERTA